MTAPSLQADLGTLHDYTNITFNFYQPFGNLKKTILCCKCLLRLGILDPRETASLSIPLPDCALKYWQTRVPPAVLPCELLLAPLRKTPKRAGDTPLSCLNQVA